jgi:hypothetical protein
MMATQADILVVDGDLSLSAKQQQQRLSASSAAEHDEDFVIGTAVVAAAEDADAEQCCLQAFDASMVRVS